MQTVTDEWKKNLNATTRKQGFVILTITRKSGANIVIDSRTNGNRISDMVHSRSYDPMGMTLPTNTISVELYNYSDAYTDWYTGDDPPVKIEAQYGYILTTAETISGGSWSVSDVQIEDDLITITGVSSLEKAEDGSFTIPDIADLPFTMYRNASGQTSHVQYTDITEPDALVGGDEIIAALDDTVPTEGNTALSSITTFFSRGVSYSPGEAVQAIANGSLQRCIIDRSDTVVFDDSFPTMSRQILYKSCKSKIAMTKSNTVSVTEITEPKEITSSDNSAATQTLEVAYSTSTGESAFKTYTLYYECDFYAYTVYEITLNHASRNFLLQCGVFDLDDGRQIRGYMLTFGNQDGPGATFTVKPRTASTSSTSQTHSTDGTVCDITNDYCAVGDTSKIVSYYDNNLIYDMDLRGYPEIDAGDYIEVQKADGSYDTCLVLSHELEFSGAFTSAIQCRRITKLFEDAPKGTHLDLSQYTHQQLGAYTHQQLSEGVI